MKMIYPGTFDPFSLGHYDLVARAAKMCESVLVGVSENKQKKPMFSFEDRINMAKLALKDIENVSVEGFTGLLVDLMRERDILYVLRGVRGMVDFEYEFQMAQVNRMMLPGFELIFLMPGEKYMVLNSTIIRDLIRYNSDITTFVSDDVCKYIQQIKERSK